MAGNMEKMKIEIFVLDDDLDDLQMTRDYFAEARLEARFFSEMGDMLAAMDRDKYYVIVVDYHLKGGATGVKVIQSALEIREMIAPIFISGVTDKAQLIDILKVKVKAYYKEKGQTHDWFRDLIELVYEARTDLDRKVRKAHAALERSNMLASAAQKILARMEKKD